MENMAYVQPDDQLLCIIDQILNIFSVFNMPKCKKVVENIKDETIKNINNKIDRNSINSKFKNLQIEFINEFSTTEHRKNIINMLTKSMRITIAKKKKEKQHILKKP